MKWKKISIFNFYQSKKIAIKRMRIIWDRKKNEKWWNYKKIILKIILNKTNNNNNKIRIKSDIWKKNKRKLELREIQLYK
jgi:hypothetical protein